MPNDRWDDFALEKQFEHIGDILAATAALPTQIAKLTVLVETNTQRLDSHHRWIETMEARTEKRLAEVKDLCERIGEELRNDAKERRRGWVSIVVAIISAAAIVAAAVITTT